MYMIVYRLPYIEYISTHENVRVLNIRWFKFRIRLITFRRFNFRTRGEYPKI